MFCSALPLTLVSEILTEIIRLCGILLRQRCSVWKGHLQQKLSHVYLSFCYYFYLVFINLLLFFSSSTNLEDVNSSWHLCFSTARVELSSCGACRILWKACCVSDVILYSNMVPKSCHSTSAGCFTYLHRQIWQGFVCFACYKDTNECSNRNWDELFHRYLLSSQVLTMRCFFHTYGT